MKRRLAAAALLASLALAPVAGAAPNPEPVPAQRAALACTLRTARNGQRVCWCKANRPGSRWQSYPRVFCQVVR